MWLGEKEYSQSSCPTDSQLLKQSFQLIDSWLLQYILRIAQYPHVTRLRSTKSTLKSLFHLLFGLVWDCAASEKVSGLLYFIDSALGKETWKYIKIMLRKTCKQRLHAIKALYCSLESVVFAHPILAVIYHMDHINSHFC